MKKKKEEKEAEKAEKIFLTTNKESFSILKSV
jgi:hypothetical protein